MITLQSGHGITLEGQKPKCSCEGQKKKDEKSINLILLSLSQLRSHKHIKEIIQTSFNLSSSAHSHSSLPHLTARDKISLSIFLFGKTSYRGKNLKKTQMKISLWRPASDSAISFHDP